MYTPELADVGGTAKLQRTRRNVAEIMRKFFILTMQLFIILLL